MTTSTSTRFTPEAFAERFGVARASAILRTTSADAAHAAMEAAVRGGFTIVEFTLTTPGAIDLIREFATRDGLIVGAGTVLEVAELHAAVDAGASFAVSPVMDETVVAEAVRMGVPIMPGTRTPTEMWQAHKAGSPLVKLFPAPGTGPKFVKSILGPMPFLRIVPTNGVHLNNAKSFLDAGAWAVGFTTSLFDPNHLEHGRFDAVEERAQKLLAAIA